MFDWMMHPAALVALGLGDSLPGIALATAVLIIILRPRTRLARRRNSDSTSDEGIGEMKRSDQTKSTRL